MRTKTTLGERGAKAAFHNSKVVLSETIEGNQGGSHIVSTRFLNEQALLIWALSSQLLVKYAELELLQSLKEGSA